MVIKTNDLSKKFLKNNSSLLVLDKINFYVQENEFVSIIGPSGCGKSTILKILSKIDTDYDGNIEVDFDEVSYMPQKDLLMPWKTIFQNIILPIELKQKLSCDIKENIKKMIVDFGLCGFESFLPHEISGGMKRRTALLRTYLLSKRIMLLDEPFSGLDSISRTKMQLWLKEIVRKYKKTIVLVTHDIDEAIFLSDRIYILSDRPSSIIDCVHIKFENRNIETFEDERFFEYKKMIFPVISGNKVFRD